MSDSVLATAFVSWTNGVGHGLPNSGRRFGSPGPADVRRGGEARHQRVLLADDRRQRGLVGETVGDEDVVVVLAAQRDRVFRRRRQRVDAGRKPGGTAILEQVADAQHRRHRERVVVRDADAEQLVVPERLLRQVEIVHVHPQRGGSGCDRAEIVEPDAVRVVEERESDRRYRLRRENPRAVIREPVRVVDRSCGVVAHPGCR